MIIFGKKAPSRKRSGPKYLLGSHFGHLSAFLRFVLWLFDHYDHDDDWREMSQDECTILSSDDTL